MHTKPNSFPSTLPCFSFILLSHTWLPDLCKITACSPVFSRAPAAPLSLEFSIRMEPKLCFRCGKSENSWKVIWNAYCRMGRRMGFLIKMQGTCTQICSFTLSNPLLASHLLSVPLGPQLRRGNHYDSFLPSFVHILQCGIFFSVQGGTSVKHRAQRGGFSEVQFSEVVCWWHQFKYSCPSHLPVPACVLQFTALSVVPLWIFLEDAESRSGNLSS